MSWEEEKQKYLSMHSTRESEDWVNWKDIKTWKQYAEEKDLPKAANPLPENSIESSKNNALADKISVFSGDITKLKIDAIVNAANKYLRAGGGVDGVIHRNAGSFLQKECDTLGGCDTGGAKITGAYKLPSKYVIQTVGPRGEKPLHLRNCYENSLKVAAENNIRTIAFPCISTGIYGYPNEAASHVASYTVRKFLEQHSDKFDRVIFCVFLDVDKNLYDQVLQAYFPVRLALVD